MAGSAAQTVAIWLAWQYLKCIYIYVRKDTCTQHTLTHTLNKTV